LAPSPDRPAKREAPYRSDSHQSRLLASTDTRQVWGMDPNEIAWAGRNLEQILDGDFQATPYAGGGLRLESVRAGSIGAARGLLAGDVLREVNGQPLSSIGDLRTLMSQLTLQSLAGLQLKVERAGKTLLLEYRPLPR